MIMRTVHHLALLLFNAKHLFKRGPCSEEAKGKGAREVSKLIPLICMRTPNRRSSSNELLLFDPERLLE
jgi:hypothetical protein